MLQRHLITCCIAVVIATWSLRDAATTIWLSAESAGAPVLVRDDTRVRLTAFELSYLPDGLPSSEHANEVINLARKTLKSEPLEASALRDLALAYQRLGNPSSRKQLMLAERISRRDIPTQNVLLRISAERGQYAPALVHLNRILSVSPEAGTKFYDAMTALVADPEGRRALSNYGSRTWFQDFAAQAVVEAGNPRDAGELLIAANMPHTRISVRLGPILLRRLIAAGDYPAAHDFAIRFGGATPGALNDFGFDAATVALEWAPLSWQLTATEKVIADLDGSAGLQAEVATDVSTVVAQRITTLPAGKYILDQQVGAGQGQGHLRVVWELNCEGAKGILAQIWQQPIPIVGRNMIHYRMHLEVPANCPAQLWRIVAAVDAPQMATKFYIAHVVLHPG